MKKGHYKLMGGIIGLVLSLFLPIALISYFSIISGNPLTVTVVYIVSYFFSFGWLVSIISIAMGVYFGWFYSRLTSVPKN